MSNGGAVSEAFLEVVRRMPKAELHCHLDGSLRASTLLTLSDDRGLVLPHRDPRALARWMRVDDAHNLEEYLSRFEITLAVMQSREELERIAQERVLDAALDGVRYLEMRFCPALHTRGGLSLDEVMQAVHQGLQRGEHDTGTVTRMIVCALRSFPWPHSMEMAELAVAHQEHGVVAFDLAGGELGNPAHEHAAAFDYARSHNLAVTVHAGEGDGPRSIHEAVHRCGANRIGHGTRLREDASLERYIVDRRIALEVCPTSNVQTRVVGRFSEHPMKRYAELGALVTINTDNTMMSGVTLTTEYVSCAQHLGLPLSTLGTLALNAFDAAFLPYAPRVALRDAAAQEIAQLLRDAPALVEVA
ncbi:adenosine deaminase [Gemmatimonas sp.]|uniref:adenosine deaminase n=1 Tax=Gemmatimonas sp. TaxID=1962908 RepID=UPI00391CC5EE